MYVYSNKHNAGNKKLTKNGTKEKVVREIAIPHIAHFEQK